MDRSLVIAGIVACVLSGCGKPWEADYSQLGLVQVSGTVKIEGQPLAHGRVIFEAADRSFSYGDTDATGRFTLMFDSKRKGVLPGSKIVRLQTQPPAEGDDLESKNDNQSTTRPIPLSYGRDSQLRLEVAGSTTIDLDLRADGTSRL